MRNKSYEQKKRPAKKCFLVGLLCIEFECIPNQNGIIDTLKASVSFINETGGGDDTTTLIWTALVIIAALALCFCFNRLYRKHLPSICGIN